jgi:hypothetical protein
MTIAWGQNAANGAIFFECQYHRLTFIVGELGLGLEEPKSATKPIRNNTLNGINVIEYALLIRVTPIFRSSY